MRVLQAIRNGLAIGRISQPGGEREDHRQARQPL